MRAAAERVRTAYADVRAGGTHQARLERDIAWDVTQRRLADLDIGESPLVFGRLDLERAVRWYVGRLAVEDEDHTPLVVDWRAPVAEPFYRATAVEPMGVVRRRHLITRKGRDVTGLDDEVFDQLAVEDEGLRVAGEGALLAALERNRTGRMGDIVATIQAEQDEAIRADVHGVLIVAGGPGTGKTAVALHRAAYLLYTHRRRLANQGVLLIGPSPVFLRYIEHVLPSLGEQDVQLSTISGLKPRLRVVADRHAGRRRTQGRPPHGARHPARGDGSRAPARARSHRAHRRAAGAVVAFRHGAHHRRHTPRGATPTTRTARTSRAASPTSSSRATRTPRSARIASGASTPPADNVTSIFDRDSALDATIASTLARGEPTPEGWEQELRVRFRSRPEVKEALERMWPVLSGAELVNDLFGFRALVRSASGSLLDDNEQELLHRPPRSRRRRARRGPKPTSRWSTKPTRSSDRSRRPDRRRGVATADGDTFDTARAGHRRSRVCGASPTRPRSPPLRRRQRRTARVTSSRSNPARSGTCSSTRRRTSPRCSGGCWPAAARRAR